MSAAGMAAPIFIRPLILILAAGQSEFIGVAATRALLHDGHGKKANEKLRSYGRWPPFSDVLREEQGVVIRHAGKRRRSVLIAIFWHDAAAALSGAESFGR